MTIARHGLTVRVPAGWDVRIFQRAAEAGEATHPVLHAATVRLPWVRGDYGSNVVDRLGADDAFVALLEFGEGAERSALFAPRGWPQLRAHDFGSAQLHRALQGQSGVQRFFHVGRRAFSLYAVLGGHSRRLLVVPRVQQLLASISTEPFA